MPKINKPKSRVVDLRSSGSKITVNKKSSAMAGREGRFSRPQLKKRSSYGRRQGSGLLTFLIALLFLLVAAALAGFFIFGQRAASRSMKLSMISPKSIASGEEVTLEINYENLDKTSLEYIELIIQYPEGFYYNESNFKPNNQDQNIWQLPPLLVGQSGQVTVKGQLFGEVKSEKDFKVVMSYQPVNFHSDFQESVDQSVKIKDALIDVSLAAPEKVEDGTPVEFKIDYQNNQELPVKDLYFAFEFGEGFKLLEATPSTTLANWLMEEVEPKKQEQIVLKGELDSAEANPFPWHFKVWQMRGEGEEAQERIIFERFGETEIIAPVLEVSLESNNQKQAVNWGEEADFKIKYKNSGQLDVKQAVLKLSFNGLIDWSSYNNSTGATRDKNDLIWLSKSGEASKFLASIPAGAEGELMITVPLISEPEDIGQLSPEELIFKTQVFMQIRFNDRDKEFSSEVLELPVTSEPRLRTEARYYLDQVTQVGSGPVPPAIGQQTVYRIYWKVFSGSTGLTNVRIKSSLPSYVKWQGAVDEATLGSPLSFDELTREVIWEINEVSPNTQLLASFDVAVTPTESQVNQLLILNNPTSFNAKEKGGSNLVSKTADLLTSDLLGDPMVQGQGRVRVE
jgi:hypothetical protein